jgi:hypothetical protein
MDEYLASTHPKFTLGSQPGREDSPIVVHGAYEVTETTLNVDQKRAIGDFVLFVAKRSLDFLIRDIETLIDAEFVGSSTPTPNTLYHSAHKALYGIFRDQFRSISDRYFIGFRDVRLTPEAITGPCSLIQNLNELSRHVLDFNHNSQRYSGARPTLLQDFVSLIRLVESSFRLTLSFESQHIIRFITFMSSERNMGKISSFTDIMWGQNADDESYSGQSSWSRAAAPSNPLLRLSHDKAEWAEVHLIINFCIHLPLHEVIVLALQDISQYYQPKRLKRDVQYHIDERLIKFRELEEQCSKEFFYTIFFHPIFIDFWCSVLQFHSADVLHNEIESLIRNLSNDPHLTEYLTQFLTFYK